MLQFFRVLYYAIPHNIKRLLFAVIENKTYKFLQNKRTGIAVRGYTFQHFEEHNCIFVHIPKTAGFSISSTIFNGPVAGHHKLTEYQITYPKKIYDQMFKFTFVRNPWDRVFSAYNFLKDGGMYNGDEVWKEKHLNEYKDFEDFVLNGIRKESILKYLHFHPQHIFICIPGKDKVGVDFLGYYENIEHDYKYILEKLSMSGKVDLKHENKTGTKKKDYEKYYTPEMIEIVGNIYKKDIELFGYNFDNSALKTQLLHR